MKDTSPSGMAENTTKTDLCEDVDMGDFDVKDAVFGSRNGPQNKFR